MQCICVGQGSRVPNLQTELNYLYSFKSYCIFSDLLSPGPRVVPASSPHRPRIISASSLSSSKQYKWRQCGPRRPRVVPALSPLSPHCLPRLSYPISSSTTPGDMPASSPGRAHRIRIAHIAPRWSPCMQCCPHHPESLQIR